MKNEKTQETTDYRTTGRKQIQKQERKKEDIKKERDRDITKEQYNYT